MYSRLVLLQTFVFHSRKLFYCSQMVRCCAGKHRCHPQCHQKVAGSGLRTCRLFVWPQLVILGWSTGCEHKPQLLPVRAVARARRGCAQWRCPRTAAAGRGPRRCFFWLLAFLCGTCPGLLGWIGPGCSGSERVASISGSSPVCTCVCSAPASGRIRGRTSHRASEAPITLGFFFSWGGFRAPQTSSLAGTGACVLFVLHCWHLGSWACEATCRCPSSVRLRLGCFCRCKP